jgi:hypothetical protein
MIVLALCTRSQALSVSWGSELFSDFRDSMGQPLDNTFFIQLGYFQSTLEDPFVPTAENVGEWASRWMIFDQAQFDPDIGYFTSTVDVNTDGSSSSPDASLGVISDGQQAYVWIYNDTTPIPGTEWFLATASNWQMPEPPDYCCDNGLPLEWSVSDLSNQGVTPIWGRQTELEGSGEYTNTSSEYTLQTYTFIPEPSSFLLTAITTIACVFRRRRNAL